MKVSRTAQAIVRCAAGFTCLIIGVIGIHDAPIASKVLIGGAIVNFILTAAWLYADMRATK